MAGTKEACLLLFVGFFVLTSAEPHHNGRYNFYEAFRSRFLCRFKRCHRYAECEVQNNTAVCVCPKVCPKKYSPVCGTNWKTYNNFCELARASCLADSRLRLRYYGPCKSGSCRRTHWQRLRCPYRSRCELVYGLPRCSCPKTCSFAYKPVCGSNGRTYRNSCELRKAACKERKWWYVKHPGHCRPDPCARIDCCCGAQCRVNETNHARCACEFACTLRYDPVCGSDGKTYGNACGLRSAACVEQNPGLRVVSKGRCEDVSTTPQNGTTEPPPVITTAPQPEVSTTPQNGTTEPPPGTTEPPATTSNPCARCRFYSTCDLRKVPPACVCPSPCVDVLKPVCGSNGVTFRNVCELQRDSCKSQLLIEVVSQGPCPTPTSNVTNPVA